MPHLVILYTPNLEGKTDLTALCRSLADAMLSVRDEDGQQIFPTGGTRVLAFPATHYAVADGAGDYGFIYLNLRMGAGRGAAVHQAIGSRLVATVKAHIAPIFDHEAIGVTMQIDESRNQVFDSKHSNLHALFPKA